MDIELKFATESVLEAGPSEALTVDPRTPVGDVLRLMRNCISGSVLIVQADRLLGIFTERDALRLMARGGDLSVPVSSVMVENPVTIHCDATIAQAILRMSSGGYRRLPVLDSAGRVNGVVQVSGIIHYLAELFPKTVYTQPPAAEAAAQRDGA